MKKKIAIIGSGIAGLTIANLFKTNSNFEIMVYEKEKILSLDEGYGIQLAPNSISVLNKIGFLNINNNNLFNPLVLNFYSRDDKKICNLDLSNFNSEKIKYTTLRRSTLIEFLKSNLFENNICFGKEIKKISKIKGKLLINPHISYYSKEAFYEMRLKASLNALRIINKKKAVDAEKKPTKIKALI